MSKSKIKIILLGIGAIIIGVITLVLALTQDGSLHKPRNIINGIIFIVLGGNFIYFGLFKK